MPNLSLDHSVTRCICIHPDTVLIPALTSVLEKNDIIVSTIDQIPSNSDWLENVSYIVWSWTQTENSKTVMDLAAMAAEKGIKLLCLFPLDRWYDSPEKGLTANKEIADTIGKINNSSGGHGDVRIVAHAGLWDSQNYNPHLIMGHIYEYLHRGEMILSDSQLIYPLEVSKAVQTIFSLWFDRGHRGKTIVLSGLKVSGADIKNNIDISGLITNKTVSFWGRKEGIPYSELVEIPTDISDVCNYFKKNIETKPDPYQTVILPVPIREVRKIESPSPIRAIPKTANPPNRGVTTRENKRTMMGVVIGALLILLLNLPNLVLLTQVLLARTLNLESKEATITTRYHQLASTADFVRNVSGGIPVIGWLGDYLITTAGTEQNHLLSIKIQASLVRAAKHMVSASPGDPFETLREAKHSLDELYVRQTIQNIDPLKRQWVSDARKVVEMLPQLIPPDKKITVLLLLQNNLELRPTGGFIGAVAILSFDHGKLLTIDTRDIYDLDSNLKGIVNPPADLKTYLNESSWYFRDSNWSPDFIESAVSANWFLEKEWGSPAEVVIGINLNTLKTILSATGPITLPNGTVVESDNLLATAFNHQDVPVAKPDTVKQEFLSQLIKPLIDNFIQASPKSAIETLIALEKAANEGELTLTSNQPAVLSELSDLGWSGSMTVPACSPIYPEPCAIDTLALNEANVGINKTNFYITRTIDHQIKLSPTGAGHTHSLTYTNKSPNDTWPGGSYKAFIRIILPERASGLTIIADGSSVTASESMGMQGFFLEVKPQATVSVAISYSVPLPASYASYQFKLIKQPGVSSDPFTITVTPPPSRSLKSLIPQLFPDSPLKYSGVFERNFSAAFTLTP